MLQFFIKEEFKQIKLAGKTQLNYAISNYGRLISYSDDMRKGRIIKGSKIEGYRIFRYKIRNEENKVVNKQLFYYRLVAEYFIPKQSEDQIFVLHLDRVRDNDVLENLKWATKEEMINHNKTSPHVLAGRQKSIETRRIADKNKLTETQVIFLKRRMLDPNRKTRIKILAKQFGVTEMTLYRIKSGENWGHVQI